MTFRHLAFVGFSAGLAVAAAAVASWAQQKENPVVVIETSMGDITVELFRDKAPLSVENFLGYVRDGLYSTTVFHRVIKGFMIQGGGLTADMNRKPTKAPIKNEATNKLGNDRGTLAMARTGEPHSATSQFFINTANNAGLNHKSEKAAEYGYAVFGKVVAGMDVVDKIEAVKTTERAGHRDVPVEPVVIARVRVKAQS